ncbi:MAG: hypothetical protein R2708_17685 [Vicinamibacterales bacterium]
MRMAWKAGLAGAVVLAACGIGAAASGQAPAPDPAASRVVLVTLDGTRWQDLFGGVDLDILRSTSGETPVEQTETYRRFWAATPEARRAKVMPFLWSRLAAQEGFLAGNRRAGSRMQVANTMRFSYPGYSELLTGAPHDEVITSNDNRRYGFLTVLEWLRRDLGLPTSGVAAFGSWETFNYIAEREEGAITINAGFEDFEHPDPEIRTLTALQHLTPNGFHGARHDVYTFRFGLAHLQTSRPRVLYLAFDETDDWAHLKRYDLVLDTLHRTDRQLEQLWTWLQADAEYRGRTTLVLTVDHGRGRTPADWTEHGASVDGAEETWLGCFGAGVTARGESAVAGPLETRQVAATIAALAGRDFRAAVPEAAAPIAACLGAR